MDALKVLMAHGIIDSSLNSVLELRIYDKFSNDFLHFTKGFKTCDAMNLTAYRFMKSLSDKVKHKMEPQEIKSQERKKEPEPKEEVPE